MRMGKNVPRSVQAVAFVPEALENKHVNREKSSAGIGPSSSQTSRREKVTNKCEKFLFLQLWPQHRCPEMQQKSNRELSQSLPPFFPIHPLVATYGANSSPTFFLLRVFCLCWRPADVFLLVHINRRERVPQRYPVVCLCQRLSLCLQAPRERTLPLFGPGPRSSPLIGIPKPKRGATLKPQSKCLSGKWRGE